MQSGERKPSAVVVELRVRPVAGAMALLASLREVRSRVVGIRCSLEILEVARHAGGAVQRVVVVDVTIGAGAWWDGVQSGEREPGAVVVKLRVHPVAGAMALLASLREVRSRVVGIRCSLEILQVARHAGGVAYSVVVVDVTIGAGARWHRVQSGEREPGAVMVECRAHPATGVVALLACLREVRSRVVGTRCSLEILQVARHAGGVAYSVVVVDVTIGAGARRHLVQSGERKPGDVMVECRARPAAGVVALLASLREVRSRVVGIRRSLEILEMAGHAGGAVQSVVIVDVAIGALPRWHGVQSCQR